MTVYTDTVDVCVTGLLHRNRSWHSVTGVNCSSEWQSVQRNCSCVWSFTREEKFKQVVSTVLSVFSSRLFWPHQRASCSASLLYAHITVLDEADDRCVVCKLQEFNRQVSWGAVIGVEGEEQWGEFTHPWGASVCIVCVLDVMFPSLTCCLLSVRKFVIHPTGGGWHIELGEFGEEDVWDDDVECQADDHKQDPRICPWRVKVLQDVVQSHVDYIIHWPVCPVGELQGVQWGACDVLQVGQHQSLEGFHDHRCQGDGPVVI